MTKRRGNLDWFGVDPEGLRKLMAGRPLVGLFYELLQNAWDEDTQQVTFDATYDGRKKAVTLRVEDDNPKGFVDLTHAWMLFAESTKKADVKKRGRFNMGEKLFLACCQEATISTTTGRVHFGAAGRKEEPRGREEGSVVEALLGGAKIGYPISREMFNEAMEGLELLIPPAGIETLVNGEPLQRRTPVLSFDETLETEYATGDGILKPTWRKLVVHLYEPGPDEEPHIYEMGIPVVTLEGGDRWHIEVQGKVPLNMNRDNVRPAYRRALRVHVLNHAHKLLEGEDEATVPWVKEAAGDKRCTEEATTQVLDLRFGKRRVAYDPSDPEANKRAMAAGYTVLSGGSLGKGEWANAKAAGAIKPAGRIMPSPKVLAAADGEDDTYPEAKVTDDMKRVVAYTAEIATALIGAEVTVRLANRFGDGHAAWYGSRRLTFNVANLGKRWFRMPLDAIKLNSLILHELGHEYSGDHLSETYYKALTDLGAKLARLWRLRPEVLETTAADYRPLPEGLPSLLGKPTE